jgi:hypothetical protein
VSAVLTSLILTVAGFAIGNSRCLKKKSGYTPPVQRPLCSTRIILSSSGVLESLLQPGRAAANYVH